MEHTLEQLLAIHLIQIWNQRDVELRTKAMENVYINDIAMYNSDEILTGYEAINHKADVVLNRFPPNFSIYQLKANIIHNNVGKLE